MMTITTSIFTLMISFVSILATLVAYQEAWFVGSDDKSIFLIKQQQQYRGNSSSFSIQLLRGKNYDKEKNIHVVNESNQRTAPYELDTTQYKINADEMVQNWLTAQRLLGLDDVRKYNVTNHHQHIINWNLNSQGKGGGNFTSLNLSVSLIAKVASEEITANLKKLIEKKEITKSILDNSDSDQKKDKTCNIAFVRDPLARFISGYVEFEWRFVQAQKKYNNITHSKQKYTFYRYPLGSKERAVAFIHDLVSFRILDWLVTLGDDQGPPPYLSWFGEHIHEEPWLYHRVGITHICPMVGRLRDQKFDFIGQLEYMDRDWNLMSQVCDLEEEPSPFDTSLINHITSTDPHNTKCAMRVALQEDECRLKKAVCLLLSADYEILSNHFPYTSCSLDCSNQ